MSTPTVLFVCVKNAGKSQMAAALLRSRAASAGERVTVFSAGTDPAESVNEEARASVERNGASFRDEHPKPIDPAVLRTADRVIVIGDEAQLEPVEGMTAQIERWSTDEPSERGIEGADRMDLIREDLERRVDRLRIELLHQG